ECLPPLIPAAGVGTGQAEPKVDRGNLRGLGRGDVRDESQDPARARLSQANRVRARGRQATRTRGLARLAGVQSPPRRARGLRLRASDRLPSGPGASCAARSWPRRIVYHPLPAPMNDAPIGIFDSGIGGLTVARAIYDRLPGESTIYFGDTARVPYGPKSPETV